MDCRPPEGVCVTGSSAPSFLVADTAVVRAELIPLLTNFGKSCVVYDGPHDYEPMRGPTTLERAKEQR